MSDTVNSIARGTSTTLVESKTTSNRLPFFLVVLVTDTTPMRAMALNAKSCDFSDVSAALSASS